MKKCIVFLLISTLLLTGCGANATTVKHTKEEQPSNGAGKNQDSKEQNATQTNDIFQPMATIAKTPMTYQSTNTTITLSNRKVDVSKVAYHIWRTADGPESMKVIRSNDQMNHFPLTLDTKDFSSKRGEYQLEAYSLDEYGKEKMIAKSEVTFQQHVPILMYHAIDAYKGQGLKGLFVEPTIFEAQMQYLKDNGYTLLTFDRFDKINRVNKPIMVTFDDGMKNTKNAFQVLKKLEDSTFKPTATLFMIAGAIDNGPYWLSSSDLKEMASSGIFSIQGHTMSHNELWSVTNYEEELKTSKEKIEQITGQPIIALAYPSGRFNDKVVEETKKYYKYATTTRPGQFISKGEQDENFLIRRVRISNDTTMAQFAAMVK